MEFEPTHHTVTSDKDGTFRRFATLPVLVNVSGLMYTLFIIVEKGGNTQVVIKGLDKDSPDGTVHRFGLPGRPSDSRSGAHSPPWLHCRNLKARHIQMISIGGTIGTGLFLGAGGAYATGGPLGILLGYVIMGAAVFSMMVALGEMTTLYPVAGAFTHYTSRFVDPGAYFFRLWEIFLSDADVRRLVKSTALGFALGWYSYAITLPTEISAAVLVIQYWQTGLDVNPAAWIAVLLFGICSFNFLGVKYYGEAEFWFAIIKVVTILGIFITAGCTPNHDPIGFRYWNQAPFLQLDGISGSKGRFLAFWKTLVKAAFSFLGTEIVALTAGEAENPRRNVPKAIRRVFYRILVFYVLGVFMIGLIVSPSDDQLLNGTGTAASPWVIAIKRSGIKALPSIINAVILTSAFSAGNVFNWLSNLSTITGLITWVCINVSFLRFYYGAKRQGIDRREFPFVAPLQPYFSYFGILLFVLVIIFNGFDVFIRGNWSASDFCVDYITLVIFAILYVGWKFWKKTKFVHLDTMDFETGRRELDAMAEEEELLHQEPTTWYGKVWGWIM
ncbi:hypothetical protein P7C70_g275, partial [Phenoliferia sp. Uapishka_3]